ncbi:MAG: polysaccharide deacetylase family protein [Rhizobiales bacterium]|nr:polysaccharide deacetylase family protein [Hyphomicrobiales bacterium]
MHILTFDVEDWFHLLEHDETANELQWHAYESRVARNAAIILECLAEADVKATFFCLGWIARTHPDVIRSIHAAGHEIGSHSNSHRLVHQLTPQLFKEDLVASISSLQDITGSKIRYYRSPGFSITHESAWAFSILAECGIEIDSSVFVSRRAHGGFPAFSARKPVVVECAGATLKEFPVVPADVGKFDLNFAGGGYFRLMPYALVRQLMARSEYVMTYFHPRDFDASQPTVPKLSPYRVFKSYVGLQSSLLRFKRLIRDFAFVDIAAADSMIDWTNQPSLKLNAQLAQTGGNECSLHG